MAQSLISEVGQDRIHRTVSWAFKMELLHHAISMSILEILFNTTFLLKRTLDLLQMKLLWMEDTVSQKIKNGAVLDEHVGDTIQLTLQ